MLQSTQNILLVDDSKSNTYILKELLYQFGYNSFETFSGKEALQILEKQSFDLILLDVIMPEMDGFEVCTILKTNEKLKKIPIIFLTALADLNSIEKGFEVGAVDYVTKPFKQQEIIARIRTHLELNAYRSNLEYLVQKKTHQLEETNIRLIEEIKQKNILQAELEGHKMHLESIVKQRTSELTESEERFRTIFEKNSSIMFLLNPENGKIIDANETAVEFYGYSRKDFKNLFIYDINPVLSESMLTQEMNNVLSLNKNYFQFKHKLSSGELRDVEVYSIPITIEQSKYVISTIHDITEKKQIHNNILNTIIETEEREKLRFAKDLHDGLGPILSTAKLYLRSLENECNNICQNNNKDIISKIEEVINEAIISAKEISNHLSPHILNNFGFVTAVKSIVKKIENTSKIRFNITANSENRFEQRVETSAYRIILELINNTLKHAKASLIDIKIFLLPEKISIIYSDNGIGFDIKMVTDNNSGMGLSNIKSRIESLNGEIEFITDIKSGFSAKFYIPLNL